jgi:predicted Zn-dependent protease
MKKEELRHDPIRESIIKGIQYLNENSASVFKLLAVIILLIGCISYYSHLGNLKSERASHIAGRAQNTFINGNFDEALVKFERVINDYPNTTGSVQSLVYLLSDAVKNNNVNTINKLLSANTSNINDLVVLSAFYKLRGDIALKNGDKSNAIKYYKKAYSSATVNALMYEIEIANAYIAHDKYKDAMPILESIMDQENIGFNVRNKAEELLAYTKQKLDI